MCVNNLPKVATQWNSGTTWGSNPGLQAQIPSVLTTKSLSHTVVYRQTLKPIVCCSVCTAGPKPSFSKGGLGPQVVKRPFIHAALGELWDSAVNSPSWF